MFVSHVSHILVKNAQRVEVNYNDSIVQKYYDIQNYNHYWDIIRRGVSITKNQFGIHNEAFDYKSHKSYKENDGVVYREGEWLNKWCLLT